MPALLRPFRPDDHAAAFHLWQITPGVGISPADEEAHVHAFLARNPGLSFVAEDQGVLAGTILCGHDGRRGLIHHMAVAASHRRQGVGQALVQAGLDALSRAGIFKCHLLCFADNAGGRAFWEAEGATLRSEVALYSFETQRGPRQP